MIENAEEITNDLKNGTPLQLSMRYSKGLVIFNFVLVALFLLCFADRFDLSNGIKTRQVIALIFLGLLLALVTYQLLFSQYAEIRGKRILLRNLFGKEQEIDLNQVTKVSSFRLRRTIYTHLIFTNDHGNQERALILNSNSALFGKEVAASEIIRLAQEVL